MKKWRRLVVSLVVILAAGCADSPDDVQGLTKEEAAYIAQTAVRQYFHVDVDTRERNITLEDPAERAEDGVWSPIYRGVPVHAFLTREAQAGEIAGVHAVIDPKTRQVLSLSIDVIGPDGQQRTSSLNEAELERKAAEFVRTEKLLTPSAIRFVRASADDPETSRRFFYYTDGLKTIAVGVDTALNQVVTFAYD
ncbi:MULTISPECIES: hypothetical protein [Brevibacillus]|uniref:hypothetical protein n=1 Tax=Brevibacillus TaxID=55080 RepID=UPI00054D63FC|nr:MULTISPECIES: hypothetical protein [Brevibacillus]UYZ13187.1 hypothetical protein A6764_20785 [Brevibacillus sp. WF146]